MDGWRDPPVDGDITLRCQNEGCLLYGETWHPEIEAEYQGELPHGGTVWFEVDEARDCPECGHEGRDNAEV